MLCSLEDVKFSNICLKMFEGIQPFKCDMLLKGVDETPNCANLVLYFSKKVQHILVFYFAFFCFQRPNNHLEMTLATLMIINVYVI